MSQTSNLKLSNVEGIRIGDALLTPEMMEADVQRWNGYALFPGIGEDNFGMSDEQLLRQFCFAYMPFILTAERPTVLRAEIVRFPYSINGNRAFQSFSCRLMPESGQIRMLKMHDRCSLAVNTQTITSEGVMMDLGNGSLYIEVYFTPRDQESLTPLRAPMGYREEVVLDPNDAID